LQGAEDVRDGVGDGVAVEVEALMVCRGEVYLTTMDGLGEVAEGDAEGRGGAKADDRVGDVEVGDQEGW
jgi:hypothetical protein